MEGQRPRPARPASVCGQLALLVAANRNFSLTEWAASSKSAGQGHGAKDQLPEQDAVCPHGACWGPEAGGSPILPVGWGYCLFVLLGAQAWGPLPPKGLRGCPNVPGCPCPWSLIAETLGFRMGLHLRGCLEELEDP